MPDGRVCKNCGFRVARLDGFDLFAPEASRKGDGYDPGLYAELALLEDRNFWFKARNRLILHVIRQYCPGIDSLLEVGCGTGQVLRAIGSAFPSVCLYGSELFVEGLAYARTRVPDAHLMQMDAAAIPFDREFDAIGAFDVIEHIHDDRKVLSEIHRALKPGGTVVVSVPQHPWLWGRQDVTARHVRRYRRHELERKLQDSGFKVVFTTSFVTLLLPAMIVSRLGGRNKSDDPLREIRIAGAVNGLLATAMRLEFALLRIGMRFPIGGSRLVVALKPE